MELPLKDRIRRAELLGLLAVVGVGLVLTWIISSLVQSRTAAAAEEHARAVTTSLIAAQLVAADVASPLSVDTSRIERAIDRELGGGEIVGVGVRRFDGAVVLAAGEVHSGVVLDPSSSLMRAFEGRAVSEVVVDPTGRRLIASYVPLPLEGDRGNLDAVAEIYQDYDAVGASFELLRKSLVPIVVIALAVLYLLLKKSWRTALMPAAIPSDAGDLRPVGSTSH